MRISLGPSLPPSLNRLGDLRSKLGKEGVVHLCQANNCTDDFGANVMHIKQFATIDASEEMDLNSLVQRGVCGRGTSLCLWLVRLSWKNLRAKIGPCCCTCCRRRRTRTVASADGSQTTAVDLAEDEESQCQQHDYPALQEKSDIFAKKT